MTRPPLTDADGEVRELTAEDFRHFRPAREVFAEIWGEEQANAMLAASRRRREQLQRRNLPAERNVSLRIDAEVLERFRATGPGWQARMNAVLRQGMPQG